MTRAQILPCLFAAFAVLGAALWSPSADIRAAEPDQVDFAILHSQATSAMQLLQASQERRLALLQPAEF